MPEIDFTPYLNNPSIYGTNTLLYGLPGSGKTDSLASYIAAGLKLRVLFTERGGHESVLKAIRRKNLPIEKFDWAYVSPATQSIANLLDLADQVKYKSYKDISESKIGLNRGDFHQYLEFLRTMTDFKSARTGESFGPVESWDIDVAFAVDGLSGVNMMARDHTVGGKLTMHEGEWGVAMEQEKKLLHTLIAGTRCHICVIAHMQRIFSDAAQQVEAMPDMLGKKLAPSISRIFNDILIAKRNGIQFSWTNIEPEAPTKFTILPPGDNLTPSFEPMIQEWAKLVDSGEFSAPTSV